MAQFAAPSLVWRRCGSHHEGRHRELGCPAYLDVKIRPRTYRALMPRYRPTCPQVVRCIALLVAMASARRGLQLRPFYARRGWNGRSAYRDLDLLRAAGVPVEEPERGWYRLPPTWIPPASANVTRDEMA